MRTAIWAMLGLALGLGIALPTGWAGTFPSVRQSCTATNTLYQNEADQDAVVTIQLTNRCDTTAVVEARSASGVTVESVGVTAGTSKALRLDVVSDGGTVVLSVPDATAGLVVYTISTDAS